MLIIAEIGYMGLIILYSLLLRMFEIFCNKKSTHVQLPSLGSGSNQGKKNIKENNLCPGNKEFTLEMVVRRNIGPEAIPKGLRDTDKADSKKTAVKLHFRSKKQGQKGEG